jgi:hypothetical protein
VEGLLETQLPNAVKMFMGKACNNLLPTKANLLRRKVVDNALCPVYLREEETIEHLLWECSSAFDVWCDDPISLQKSPSIGLNFIQLFEYVLTRCATQEVQLFVVMAMRIWLRRNDVVHRGFFTHPAWVLREASKAVGEFHQVNDRKEGLMSRHVQNL